MVNMLEPPQMSGNRVMVECVGAFPFHRRRAFSNIVCEGVVPTVLVAGVVAFPWGSCIAVRELHSLSTGEVPPYARLTYLSSICMRPFLSLYQANPTIPREVLDNWHIL